MITLKLLSNMILLKIFEMIFKFQTNYKFKNYAIVLLFNLIKIKFLSLVKQFLIFNYLFKRRIFRKLIVIKKLYSI